MTQTGVVARLALRELWISFRLLLVLVAFTGAGAAVALLPAPLPTTMGRLALGLGMATLVASAVAAWSMADERRTGRAGWLISRSVPRQTFLTGWFAALAGVAGLAVTGAAALGWLAAVSVSVRLEPIGYAGLAVGIGATTMAAIALGLLAGALLPGRGAATLAVLASLLAGAAAWLLPIDATLVPGGAYAALAALLEPGSSLAPGLRAAGVGLGATAILLVAARAAVEGAEL